MPDSTAPPSPDTPRRAPPARPKYTRGAKIVIALTLLLVLVILPRLNDIRMGYEIASLRRAVPSFESFSPSSGDFVVLMPPHPTHSTQVHPLGGNDTAGLDVWSALSGINSYNVFLRDLPARPDDSAIETMGVALQSHAGAKTLDDRVFRTNGMLIREFSQSTSDVRRIDTRLIIAGRRMYMLVVRTNDPAANADTSQFFDSFKILHPMN